MFSTEQHNRPERVHSRPGYFRHLVNPVKKTSDCVDSYVKFVEKHSVFGALGLQSPSQSQPPEFVPESMNESVHESMHNSVTESLNESMNGPMNDSYSDSVNESSN